MVNLTKLLKSYKKILLNLQDDVSDIEDKNNSQDTNLTTLGNSVNSLQEQVNTTKDTANKASAKANEVGNQLNDFKGTKGENGGIAPLNEYGKVPSRYLPASMDDVKDFDGFVEKSGCSTIVYREKFNG